MMIRYSHNYSFGFNRSIVQRVLLQPGSTYESQPRPSCRKTTAGFDIDEENSQPYFHNKRIIKAVFTFLGRVAEFNPVMRCAWWASCAGKARLASMNTMRHIQ